MKPRIKRIKSEIGLVGYAHRDPVVEFKRQGFEMFDNVINRIKTEVTGLLLNVKIEVQQNKPLEQKRNIKPIEVIEGGIKKSDKIAGRNDPCPCGSGKKYKNCCG